MGISRDEIVQIIANSTPIITQDGEGNLSVIFNPNNVLGSEPDASSGATPKTAGLKVCFALTRTVGEITHFASGVSLALADGIPNYIADNLKDLRLKPDAENSVLELEFQGGDNRYARFLRKSLTDMAEQLGGFDIVTEDNVVSFVGDISVINDFVRKLSEPSVEAFLKRRAENMVNPYDDGEDKVVPLVR